MVDKVRKRRIEELIQRQLGVILLKHRKSPLFATVTITSVDMSPDLSMAKVFFCLFAKEQLDETKKVLKEETWYLRKMLAHDLNLRRTPKLNFIHDESVERGSKLSALIDEAVARDAKKPV